MEAQNQQASIYQQYEAYSELLPDIEVAVFLEKILVSVIGKMGFRIRLHGRVTSGWEEPVPWCLSLIPFESTLTQVICATIDDNILISMHTRVAPPFPNVMSSAIPAREFKFNEAECYRKLQADIFQPIRNSILGSLGLQSPCLLNIPGELKWKICEYLGPRDRAALSLSCRTFCNICHIRKIRRSKPDIPAILLSSIDLEINAMSIADD